MLAAVEDYYREENFQEINSLKEHHVRYKHSQHVLAAVEDYYREENFQEINSLKEHHVRYKHSQHVLAAVEDYYREENFQEINSLRRHGESYFLQEVFFPKTLILHSANDKTVSVSQDVCNMYQTNIEKLKLH